MPFLKNLGGRIVEVAGGDDYNLLLAQHFTIPTEEEIKNYQDERVAKVMAMQNPIEYDASVYMATVSQGGKDGYGIASANIVKELRKLGTEVSLSNTGQKIGLLFHAPYSLIKMENDFRLIYTMFESDKIPDDWVEFLQLADKVLVPSKWCQSVFAKARINTEVVTLGYDDTVFKYVVRKNKRKARKDFCFLHYNAFNIRKGFTEVLKAFTQEFAPDEPVKMIFKTTLEHPPLPLPPSQYPNIQVLTGAVSDKDLAALCQSADCFVFPSRGEGFGMTPLEAMATGLPAIVPNAHGITEYFNDEYMYEVAVKEMCPALYARYKDQDVGQMVVCDIDDLAKQMRYVYEHQEEAMEKGKLASEYVKNWTFSKTAEQLKAIIEDTAGKPAPIRPLRNILSLEKVK